MHFYADFCLPFIIGAAVMGIAIITKYAVWFCRLPSADRMLVLKGLPTYRTLEAVWETIRESLLHRRIFRVNRLLGYMHMSLAFGWFLLIVTGWIETVAYVGLHWVPLQGHVFFKYFMPLNGIADHKSVFDFVMDLLLLFVLSGVALAWFKRVRSRALGMRRTTKHILPDRVALTALWFVFPARLVAESLTCGIYGGGSFLTGGLGSLFDKAFGPAVLAAAYEPAWWFYSCALGIFFAAMPFSRYMHIFTEVPLIFLRRYKLQPSEHESSYDNFEIQACSRCGICLDPCQLQSSLGINDVQSVYFLRDRRYKMREQKVANNCLMCGRCEQVCPVGINLNTLRLNSRTSMRNRPDDPDRYNWLHGIDPSSGEGCTGYFAGCMTRLTPRTLTAMERIFDAAGEQVWWADREGGVCCGRPLKLSGEADAARKMAECNTELFRRHGITTLVTSCPICLREFREVYKLDGIEILHHSEYILRLIESGRLHVSALQSDIFTYHDPCELGRGCGIYDEPRAVIESVGRLVEPAHSRHDALCCGSSLANTSIDDVQQLTISRDVTSELDATAAATIVTSCPLCKKALSRTASKRVADLSEIVAERISN